MRGFTWCLLVGVAGGCTAAKAQIQILSAEEGLHTATDQHADRVAVFEYEMATLYLQKAKEEAGYSDYRMADALARQAAEWADRAIIFVQRHGRGQGDTEPLTNDAGAPTSNPTTVQPAPAPKQLDDLDDELDIGPGAKPAPTPQPAPAGPKPAPAPAPAPKPAPKPVPKK